MTKTDAQKNKNVEKEIAASCFIHRLKSMAAGDDFLKGDLYEAWLGTLDKSILDENFKPLFCEREKGLRLNIKYNNI